MWIHFHSVLSSMPLKIRSLKFDSETLELRQAVELATSIPTVSFTTMYTPLDDRAILLRVSAFALALRMKCASHCPCLVSQDIIE